jgi:carbonic anhydrase
MSSILKDFIASFGLFSISLPLSIGVALASSLTATSGLISSIIGGVLVGWIGGAPFVVSGPTATLLTLILAIITRFGLAGLQAITLITGFFQIIFGSLRGGKAVRLIPESVVGGLLSAVGIMVAISQLEVILGGNPTGQFMEVLAVLSETLSNLQISRSHIPEVVVLGASGILFQKIWHYIPKLNRFPSTFPTVLLFTLFTLNDTLPRVEFEEVGLSAFQSFLSIFKLETWNHLPYLFCWGAALALLASMETLLSAKASEELLKVRKQEIYKDPNLDRELLAQGMGNIVCSFVGGAPLSGLVIRTAANISYGAVSRLANVLHGLWIALFLIFAPNLLKHIPLTILASVLLPTSLKLVNLKKIRYDWHNHIDEFCIWLTTFGLILTSGPMIGIGIGWATFLLIRSAKKFL